MRPGLLISLVLTLVLTLGCEQAGQEMTASLSDPAGAFSFEVPREPVSERSRGGKVLWDLLDARVTIQRITRTNHNRDLSLAEVANALGSRFALEGSTDRSQAPLAASLTDRPNV